MYVRLTLLEIDTLRVDNDTALMMFEAEVLPRLRQEPGYQGVLVLTTPEGKSALLSFWSSAESAAAEPGTDFYSDTLDRYLTIFRSPPGRTRYEVAYAELPATATS